MSKSKIKKMRTFYHQERAQKIFNYFGFEMTNLTEAEVLCHFFRKMLCSLGYSISISIGGCTIKHRYWPETRTVFHDTELECIFIALEMHVRREQLDEKK